MKPLLLILCLPACGDPIADAQISVDPAVEAVSPPTVPSRGGVEVTVIGNNLVAGSSVTVGGQPVLGLTLHGKSRLTFVAPRQSVGPKDLVVQHPNGQTAVMKGALTYFAEQIQFADRSLILREDLLGGDFLIGDIDGDARDDLVAKERDGSLVPFLSRSGGQILERRPAVVKVDVQTYLSGGRLADLNGDGRADLVFDGNLYLALGDGTFSPAIALGSKLRPEVAAFDGGGRLELGYFDGDTLSIYGVSAMGEVSLVRTVSGLTVPLYRQNVADVNRDGVADLLVTDDQKCLEVRLGPALAPQAGPCVGRYFTSMDVRDVNGDGKLDLVGVANYESVYTLYGHDDGSFDAPRLAAQFCSGFQILRRPPSSHYQVRNTLDGTKDPPDAMLISCFTSVEAVAWSLGVPVTLATYATAGGWLGDLDGDGIPDLITLATGGVTALYGGDKGGYFDPHPGSVVMSADPEIHNAGVTPIVARGHFPGGLKAVAGWIDNLELLAWDGVRLAPTSQQLRLGAETPSWDLIQRLAACDLDDDGQDDLIAQMQTSDSNGYGLSYFQAIYVDAEGLRAGPLFGLSASALVDSVDGPFQVGDLDGDHRCDLLQVRAHFDGPSYQRASTVWLNRAEGFEPHPLDIEANVVALGDAEGDGDLDLFALDQRFDSISQLPSATLWHNDGNGAFQPTALTLPLDGVPGQPALGLATDLRLIPRADGGADLWFVARESPDLADPMYLAIDHLDVAGQLMSTTVSRISGDYFFNELRLGDINGDGLADALAVPGTGRHAQLAVSRPDGTLGPAVDVELAPEVSWSGGNGDAYLADLVDYDGDGLDDIVYVVPQYAWGKIFQVRNLSE